MYHNDVTPEMQQQKLKLQEVEFLREKTAKLLESAIVAETVASALWLFVFHLFDKEFFEMEHFHQIHCEQSIASLQAAQCKRVSTNSFSQKEFTV